MSYDLARRTSEIGVRMALGANRKNIFGLILCTAMTLAVLGLSGHSISSERRTPVSSQLYGVNPRDPVIVTSAAVALALSAFVAALVPAFRASSISPAEAVRAE